MENSLLLNEFKYRLDMFPVKNKDFLLKGRRLSINFRDHKRICRESLKRRLQTTAWAYEMVREFVESK